VKFILLLAVALVFEALRLAWLARMPVAPDLLLGLTILLALRRRPPAAAGVGFLLGSLRDFIQGDPMSVETAAFTLSAWGASSLGRTIYRDSIITQGLMILGAGLVRGWLRYVTLSGEGTGGMFPYLVRVSFPSALATAILLPWAGHYLQRLGNRLRPGRRRRRRRGGSRGNAVVVE
jgi:rod shape-determining protein MreD